MKAFSTQALVLIGAAALAGCAGLRAGGDDASGVDVTRLHLGQPLARAQIAVEAANAADANSPDFRSFSSAVGRQLARHGYTVVPTIGKSELVALVDVRQGSRAALMQGWPASAEEVRSRDNMVGTLLDVRIRRRSDGTVFWEGRAVTEAPVGSPEAGRPVAVEKLAEALFRDFPGESGRTIRLR